MNKEKIIIIGSEGHGKVIADIIEKQGTFSIAGFVNANPQPKTFVMGYPVLGSDNELVQLRAEFPNCHFFIAIGDNSTRHKVKLKIESLFSDIAFPSIIHPSAQIARDVKIGKGVCIMAGVVINSSSNIGDFCILNTKAGIDHDNSIGDFSSLAPNTTTGGDVSIGDFSAIGISATIKHGIKIGKHSVIGAASYINKNLPDNVVAYGIPGKIIRPRIIGEKYL
jgi:sugar O-acyltransferase (sialic acid O-acetyltransferase NeuD family)